MKGKSREGEQLDPNNILLLSSSPQPRSRLCHLFLEATKTLSRHTDELHESGKIPLVFFAPQMTEQTVKETRLPPPTQRNKG